MNAKDAIYNSIKDHCPKKYRINEILFFGYPYYKVKAKFLVNKSPEKSLKEVYKVFIRSIAAGLNTKASLAEFLGLSDSDFLWKELFILRDSGLLDLVGNTWKVTSKGEDFLKDSPVMNTPQDDLFEFLVDGMSGDVEPSEVISIREGTEKRLPALKYDNHSPDLVLERFQSVAELYKQLHKDSAYIIDFDKDKMESGKLYYKELAMIEYVPLNNDEDAEPYLEIREAAAPYKKLEKLTKAIEGHYPDIVYAFSDTEREIIPQIQLNLASPKLQKAYEKIELWNAIDLYRDSINTARECLLIEVPRIRASASKFIQPIENALKRGVNVTLLYGLENYTHDNSVLNGLAQLRTRFQNQFKLVNLPDHFKAKRNNRFTGSHRRVLVKDNEYIINSTFNFFSSNLSQGQRVSNEDVYVIREGAAEEREKILKDYGLVEGKTRIPSPPS